MQPILILTKNLIVEQPLQNDLQQLGYEVFCTKELLNKIRISVNAPYLFQPYPIIILSGTLSNFEIKEFIQFLNNENQIVLRKFLQTPTLEEENQLEELGINDWFDADQSLDSLREKLGTHLNQLMINSKLRGENYQECGIAERLESFDKQLTKKERALFNHLMKSKNNILSRAELCSYLWQDKPNNSHLSQLSLMVQHIKRKLRDCGINDIRIETSWGKGYQLHSTFEYAQIIEIREQ